SKNVLETIWSEKSKRIAPVWLAHYTKQTNYEGDYAIWQASAYGRIPGIAGDVDMDIRYLKKNG
ncbi:MAG: glycoside hydrolase family 25, partial [Oscillospiraceae bacterium]|nr:glycoside hydrolase family 25 [Oscillospiraceae bacterium]